MCGFRASTVLIPRLEVHKYVVCLCEVNIFQLHRITCINKPVKEEELET